MDFDDIGLSAADLTFLEACDNCAAGELGIATVIEGQSVEEGQAMKAHAESMVRRGYFERVASGGSRSRMQGARLRCVYRRTPAGEAVLALVQSVRELEASVERKPVQRTPTRRSQRPFRVFEGHESG